MFCRILCLFWLESERETWIILKCSQRRRRRWLVIGVAAITNLLYNIFTFILFLILMLKSLSSTYNTIFSLDTSNAYTISCSCIAMYFCLYLVHLLFHENFQQFHYISSRHTKLQMLHILNYIVVVVFIQFHSFFSLSIFLLIYAFDVDAVFTELLLLLLLLILFCVYIKYPKESSTECFMFILLKYDNLRIKYCVIYRQQYRCRCCCRQCSNNPSHSPWIYVIIFYMKMLCSDVDQLLFIYIWITHIKRI